MIAEHALVSWERETVRGLASLELFLRTVNLLFHYTGLGSFCLLPQEGSGERTQPLPRCRGVAPVAGPCLIGRGAPCLMTGQGGSGLWRTTVQPLQETRR